MECGLKREAKERDFGDESKYTVLFTAGTAVLMACLKRFVIMMFFIEQWRLWVFFLLNVVLLAIFFTSMHHQQSEDQDVIVERKKPPQGGKSSDHHHQYGNVKGVKVEEKCEENQVKKKLESVEVKKDDDDGGEEEEEEETACRLSKEELNERVEAFIATFRRQLVSDAIRSGRRSPDHHHDHYSFSKKKMMRENINGVSNFVKLELERRSSRTMMRTFA